MLLHIPRGVIWHCDARKVLGALSGSSRALVSPPHENMETPKLSLQSVAFNRDPAFMEISL